VDAAAVDHELLNDWIEGCYRIVVLKGFTAELEMRRDQSHVAM
jgi:hypothetical protein